MQMNRPVASRSTSGAIPFTDSDAAIGRVTILVTVICWLAIFVEGYDLVVYGVVMPRLMDPSEWGLSPTDAGAMGSYALLGMFIGSSFGGILSDKYGRKPVLNVSLILLAAMMFMSAIATTPTQFAIYRLIAGLGIGGLVPAASALTTEYAPARSRSFVFVLMYTGFAFGGVFAALMGVLFINSMGWRFLFWLGTIPIILVPVVQFVLPESIRFLQTANRHEEARKIIDRFHLQDALLTTESQVDPTTSSLASILTRRYLAATILFSLIYIMAFLLIYGMNVWLPKVMQQVGYPMKSSLMFLLTFNFAAIIGGVIAGRVADRIRPKNVIATTYFLAALSIILLSWKLDMVLLYLLIAIAGFGTTGTTFVLASFVMRYYNAHNRATALGIVSAIGRFGAVAGPILVGVIVSAGLDIRYVFYFFCGIAIAASLLVLSIPMRHETEV